jgi:hypothetical protein
VAIFEGEVTGSAPSVPGRASARAASDNGGWRVLSVPLSNHTDRHQPKTRTPVRDSG